MSGSYGGAVTGFGDGHGGFRGAMGIDSRFVGSANGFDGGGPSCAFCLGPLRRGCGEDACMEHAHEERLIAWISRGVGTHAARIDFVHVRALAGPSEGIPHFVAYGADGDVGIVIHGEHDDPRGRFGFAGSLQQCPCIFDGLHGRFEARFAGFGDIAAAGRTILVGLGDVFGNAFSACRGTDDFTHGKGDDYKKKRESRGIYGHDEICVCGVMCECSQFVASCDNRLLLDEFILVRETMQRVADANAEMRHPCNCGD